jgi:hypothetical protein
MVSIWRAKPTLLGLRFTARRDALEDAPDAVIRRTMNGERGGFWIPRRRGAGASLGPRGARAARAIKYTLLARVSYYA